MNKETDGYSIHKLATDSMKVVIDYKEEAEANIKWFNYIMRLNDNK